MGVLHTVLLLDTSCAEWLDREGVSHPATEATSRFPTPSEIIKVLRQLVGYTFSVTADSSSGEWFAQITASNSSTGAWAFLRVSDYCSDDKPHEFYFPKGWPEVIFTVVERLTHYCGPLVVVDDSSVRPIVVRPHDSVQELLRNYHVA